MAEHNEFGVLAEDLAADYLVEKGYTILTRNFRYLKAEIDIIAETEENIVIVEVKARSSDAFILPQEAVNKKKIRLLVLGANHFIEERQIDKEARFDIISVLPDEKNKLHITHLENAFSAIDAT